jgi:DNA-binding response OmpR family regulator/nitrogen-specific signal transduction histidine kinase
MVIVGALAIRGWREKIETNRRLEEYNHKIVEQRNEISEMARRAEISTQEKIGFFTNISHEFRTPLSLILLPIDDLLAKSKDTKTEFKEGLVAIKRNAIRLLRLVNQLMDFRKIEGKKMKVQAYEMDIVKFIREAMVSFEKLAVRKNITFRLQTELDELRVWFDADKLDKVVFNLISNAFKFTKEGGQITVTVTVSEKGDETVIFFEDTGVGMSPEDVAHAFDPFYLGENASHNGVGLGLSLSREFVALHHGSLSVSSERWKGTRFCLRLLLGKAHLEKDEFAAQALDSILDPYYSIIVDEGLETAKQPDVPDARLNLSTILIIDDSVELVNFMKARLEKIYNVIIAYDGINGLQQAFDTVPDLIICDILLPGKSGIELTKILKSDLRTSHIPVIILTARGALEQKIEGIQIGADEFISKPFVFEFLNERIKALVTSRERLKEHYSHDIHIEPQLGSPGQLDRRFIGEFKALVEKNLSRADFNVNDISRELGMSRIQVYRKVNALFGYSIHDFLINVRLKKAKSLLLETDKRISDIAFEVGFSSAAYFSTAFRSKIGLSPKDFKNQRLAKS